MSLINCPECNKEISDKANSCPNCGLPLNQKNAEEYLACPKCYSKELHTEKSGFSGKKAVAGAVLTGGIGLLAGTIGSKDIYITCLKCNHRFKAGDAQIIKEGELKTDLDSLILRKFKDTNSVLQAVKFHHDETKAPLVESKQYVENLLSQNNIDWKLNSGTGCLFMLLILISLGFLTTYILV